MRSKFGNRGVVNTSFGGDSNSSFFHSFANGRRRKCTIWNLESEEGSIHEKEDLRRHIEGYYKKLFGGEERGQISLSNDLWRERVF
jgi:hypothetical protein